MKIEILDLGINNINSVVKVFEGSLEPQDSIKVIDENSDSVADLVVLPGLGKFSAAMDSIKSKGFNSLISRHIESGGKIVGICLGMHLLGSISEESENVFGLNLIPGVTKRLPEQKNERIPNMGWLGTQKLKVNSGFKSLEANKDFYFVHSYEFVPDDVNNILSTSLFGRYEFVSGVLTDRICAFQFHPEKSAKIGKSLVMEIVGWARDEI